MSGSERETYLRKWQAKIKNFEKQNEIVTMFSLYQRKEPNTLDLHIFCTIVRHPLEELELAHHYENNQF